MTDFVKSTIGFDVKMETSIPVSISLTINAKNVAGIRLRVIDTELIQRKDTIAKT
jgi:hypothetical protein